MFVTTLSIDFWHPIVIIIIITSYYKSSNVCLFVCLSVCSLSPPRSFDRSSPNLVGVCRWTSELPLRGSFSKRSTARRVKGSLSLSTILYMCQPHSTQLQKATLLLLYLIRLKGTFCSTGHFHFHSSYTHTTPRTRRLFTQSTQSMSEMPRQGRKRSLSRDTKKSLAVQKRIQSESPSRKSQRLVAL